MSGSDTAIGQVLHEETSVKTKIENIVDIQIGYQFREKLDMALDGTHQVIQAKNIDAENDHRLNFTSIVRVTLKRDAKKYVVNNGDVIFLSKGRRNYATLIEGLSSDTKAIAAGYFFILRPKVETIRTDYLALAINEPSAQSYLKSVASGSGMPFISKQAFAALEIDIPAAETQEKVVKLHQLSFRESALLKRLEQKRNKLIRGICLKAIRQAAR